MASDAVTPPNTLYTAKLVHLCETGGPTTCTAQLSGMPGQSPRWKSQSSPAPLPSHD